MKSEGDAMVQELTSTSPTIQQKTAGKRIEALRRAERNNSVVENNDYRESKSSRTSQGNTGGQQGWNDGYAGQSDMDEPRLHEVKREHHHFYTNQAQGQQSSYTSNAYPHGSIPWNPVESPRSRSHHQQQQQQQQQVEYERQVRFHYSTGSNFPRANSPTRSQYDVNGLPPYSTQQQQSVSAEHYHQYPDEIGHPYLPSPAQYFAQPVPRNNSYGGETIGGGTLSTSASSVTLDEAMPPPMSSYPLQSSILPPFSTSMADQLFNEHGVFDAGNFFNESVPPPLIPTGGQQTMLDILGTCAPSGETTSSMDSSVYSVMDTILPFSVKMGKQIEEIAPEEEVDPLSDSVLIPNLALFYEKLGGVMPVFSRNWLFSKLDKDDHHHDAQFAAMLLAMSALTVIQVQQTTPGKDKKAERQEKKRRRARAVKLLDEALKAREGPFMGQHVSLEACFTSFCIFGALFGLGEHSAAWYRLREAITLGHLCRLHEPASYEGLAKDEAERRLRAYWILAITERAFALQRGMPIILTGNPRASTANLRAKLGLKELSDFPDLQLKLFDVVDENFVDCWNRKCPGQGCRHFDRDRAIALWKSFTDDVRMPLSAPASARERSFGTEQTSSLDTSEQGSEPPSRQRSYSHRVPPTPTPVQRRQIQRADVEVTRHWLLNRLWLITLSHGLLSIDAREPPLRVDHAIHVAKSVLDICNYNLSLASMEAHGVGFTYKLYDIAQTLVMLCKDEKIAEAISKGGLGDQLKGQTTAAHTNGREVNTSLEDKDESLEDESKAMVVDTSGPIGLRRTVLRILREYLVLFEKFRHGDHPYLVKLEESINEVEGQVGPDSGGAPQEAM
jgi:hypothetical protein